MPKPNDIVGAGRQQVSPGWTECCMYNARIMAQDLNPDSLFDVPDVCREVGSGGDQLFPVRVEFGRKYYILMSEPRSFNRRLPVPNPGGSIMAGCSHKVTCRIERTAIDPFVGMIRKICD